MSSDDADDWNQHWEQYADSAEQNPAQRWRRTLILERLGLDSSAKVLDIGSGQGDLARDLLDHQPAIEIHGLELGASGIAAARAKAPTATFHEVDLLSDDAVVEQIRGWANLVVCSEVLEHVDEPTRLLRAGLQHAETGARVVITVPAGPRTAFDRHIGHRQHFTADSITAVMTAAGVIQIHVVSAGLPFFNLYRIVVLLRGKRLIAEMSSGESGTDSLLGRAVLKFFDITIPWSRRRGRLGWQLVATGTWSGANKSTTL